MMIGGNDGQGAGGIGGARRPQRVVVNLAKLWDRPAPCAPEAEMALLGAMILEPKVIGDVAEILAGPDDFYNVAHATIYRILVDLYNNNRAGDLVQLVERLRGEGSVNDVGGPAYLEKLAAETPGVSGATFWAALVAGKARLRKLITACGKAVHDAYHHEDAGNVTEVIDAAEQAVFEVAQAGSIGGVGGAVRVRSLGEILQAEIDAAEAREGNDPAGIPTGFYDLDSLITGLEPGQMIIVAARPAMGKTAFATQLAEQIARRVPVGIFSLEMSKGALVQRLLAARSGVTTQEFKSGKLGSAKLARINRAAADLAEIPLYIDDTTGLTAMGFRARARRMVRQFGVGVIVLDYLQLMTAPGRQENRQTEVASISRSIKALAGELGVPIVCLSQLNRGPENRQDNRPRMSDLRESGAIEQDADVVLLLHREDYYHTGDPAWFNDPDNDDKKGVAEVIVSKQRSGPTGVVYLKWEPEATRFRNRARGDASRTVAPSTDPANLPPH